MASVAQQTKCNFIIVSVFLSSIVLECNVVDDGVSSVGKIHRSTSFRLALLHATKTKSVANGIGRLIGPKQ